MVVCTPLMDAPANVTSTRTGQKLAGEISITLRRPALTMATADIASIEMREPSQPIAAPPTRAPRTPPKLKAVMPVLASDVANPAPVSSAVNHASPRYTDNRQQKNAAQRATVSRRNSCLNREPIDSVAVD